MCDCETFDRVWDRLALQGQCDIRGGVEYQRVKGTWVFSGMPEDIAGYIRAWANMDGDGRPAVAD